VGQLPTADFAPVSPQYFDTLQVPVLEGRDFTERDDATSPQVMIVNQAFAKQFFNGAPLRGGLKGTRLKFTHSWF